LNEVYAKRMFEEKLPKKRPSELEPRGFTMIHPWPSIIGGPTVGVSARIGGPTVRDSESVKLVMDVRMHMRYSGLWESPPGIMETFAQRTVETQTDPLSVTILFPAGNKWCVSRGQQV
jgi:hypothetical protein